MPAKRGVTDRINPRQTGASNFSCSLTIEDLYDAVMQ